MPESSALSVYQNFSTPRGYARESPLFFPFSSNTHDLIDGCTVAIVNLASFPGAAQDLPGQPPSRPRAPHVITTFNEIWLAGQYVFENCVNIGRYGRQPSAGWNNAGELLPLMHAIGGGGGGLGGYRYWYLAYGLFDMGLLGSARSIRVFFWATGSAMDRRVAAAGLYCWGYPCPPTTTTSLIFDHAQPTPALDP